MPVIELRAEQLQLAKIINDHTLRFPNTEIGETDLLRSCYDYMDAFKHVMDSTHAFRWITLANNTMAFIDSPN